MATRKQPTSPRAAPAASPACPVAALLPEDLRE